MNIICAIVRPSRRTVNPWLDRCTVGSRPCTGPCTGPVSALFRVIVVTVVIVALGSRVRAHGAWSATVHQLATILAPFWRQLLGVAAPQRDFQLLVAPVLRPHSLPLPVHVSQWVLLPCRFRRVILRRCTAAQCGVQVPRILSALWFTNQLSADMVWLPQCGARTTGLELVSGMTLQIGVARKAPRRPIILVPGIAHFCGGKSPHIQRRAPHLP